MSRNLLKKMMLSSMAALSMVASAHALPPLVQDAADGLINGCTVKLNVSGWANQIYVDDQFAGNFQNGSEDLHLARTIDNYIYSGRCSYKSAYEINLIRSPYLVQDFVDHQYRNCYVKLNVSGWANQIYINGNFSGNYDSRTEEMKLRSALVNYIMNGTCQYAPIGGHPQPYPPQPPVPYPPLPPTPLPPAPQPPLPPSPPVGHCPAAGTVWDARLQRCVSVVTPPRPVGVTCTIHGFSATSTNIDFARREALRQCAAASRGYVCAGSQVVCR